MAEGTVVLEDGSEREPTIKLRPTDCPECGAEKGRFQGVLGGQECCMNCGHTRGID